MELKIQNIKLVDCFELDELATRTFGRRYSSLESGNGEYNNGSVEFVSVPDRYPYQGDLTVEQWLATPLPDQGPPHYGQEYDLPSVRTVMDELGKRGIIEPGEYAVHLHW
jgi:hypothetical protein